MTFHQINRQSPNEVHPTDANSKNNNIESAKGEIITHKKTNVVWINTVNKIISNCWKNMINDKKVGPMLNFFLSKSDSIQVVRNNLTKLIIDHLMFRALIVCC